MRILPSATCLCLSLSALPGCAGGAGRPDSPSVPVIRIVEARPTMTAAQAAEPQGCPPPVAQTAGELAEEDARCSAHADALARWVSDLQAVIRGAGGDQ